MVIDRATRLAKSFFKRSEQLTAEDVKAAREYIAGYWSNLERFHPKDDESLLGLPKPYLVPSYEEGHEFDFNEMYYWDSYFMVQGLLDLAGSDLRAWGFILVLFLSGFATLVATLRIGIRTFWGSEAAEPPRILALEFAPILVLVALLATLSVKAEVTLGYMVDTTDALMQPTIYAEGVLGAPRAEEGSE